MVKGLCILKMRVRESFTHGGGISTPRARHKGRQPLIECANHDCKTMYIPFLCFIIFFLFYVFFYLFAADKGVSLAPTYPQVR